MDLGYLYQVEDSEIFVSSRPKRFTSDKTGYDPDAYLSVTDTFCSPIVGKILMWFPWNEGRKPIPECYYATVRTLIWWVEKLRLPKIQIFCDGGTHRSVTVFGAYLLATYSENDAAQIVKNRTPYVTKYTPLEEGHRDPLMCIKRYLQEFPEDWLLLKAIKEDRLGRLDAHSVRIFNLVKTRYQNEQ